MRRGVEEALAVMVVEPSQVYMSMLQEYEHQAVGLPSDNKERKNYITGTYANNFDNLFSSLLTLSLSLMNMSFLVVPKSKSFTFISIRGFRFKESYITNHITSKEA